MPFVKILDSYSNLSIDCQSELRKKVKRVICHKGSILLTTGEINQHLFMVEKGLLRVFHYIEDDENREITSWFVQNGDIAFSAPSFFKQKPSDEFIEVLEDTILYKLSYYDLYELYEKFVELNWIARTVMESFIQKQQFRIRLLTHKNVLKRYKYFLDENPTVGGRVSLKMIATCLDVEYHHLSRIRKEL